jgi:hypothetical protein
VQHLKRLRLCGVGSSTIARRCSRVDVRWVQRGVGQAGLAQEGVLQAQTTSTSCSAGWSCFKRSAHWSRQTTPSTNKQHMEPPQQLSRFLAGATAVTCLAGLLAEARRKQLALLCEEPPPQLRPAAVRQPQHEVGHLRITKPTPAVAANVAAMLLDSVLSTYLDQDASCQKPSSIMCWTLPIQ